MWLKSTFNVIVLHKSFSNRFYKTTVVTIAAAHSILNKVGLEIGLYKLRNLQYFTMALFFDTYLQGTFPWISGVDF